MTTRRKTRRATAKKPAATKTVTLGGQKLKCGVRKLKGGYKTVCTNSRGRVRARSAKPRKTKSVSLKGLELVKPRKTRRSVKRREK